MSEWLRDIIVAVTGLVVGYLGRQWMTRRERKHDDLKLIDEAINPLVESIKVLTTQNNDLIRKLQEEQTARLKDIDDKRQLLAEKETLQKQIEKLNRKIEELNRKIEELKGMTRRMQQELPSNDN